MVQLLKENPTKIPSPTRDDMMRMFDNAWKTVYNQLDNVFIYKRNMITLALDGSEDYLASRKLFSLVGEEMLAYREELLKKSPPANLKELRKLIIPPEGVKYKKSDVPEDEGCELWDGEEEEEEWDEEVDGEISSDDEANTTTTEVRTAPVQSQEIPPSVVAPREDVIRFDKIGEAIKAAKNGASNSLLPHLIKMENTFMNQRRRLLRTGPSDGILVETLNSTSQQGEATDDEDDEEMRVLRAEREEHDARIQQERLLEEHDAMIHDAGEVDGRS